MRNLMRYPVMPLAFAVALALACAPVADAADVTLKAQFFLPKGHPISKRLADIYQEIETASGRRVKIQGFWAGELVPTPQALDGLVKGTLDILVGPGNYYSGKIAIADIGIMPINFKRAADRSKVMYETEVGPLLDRVFRKSQQVTVVGPFNYFIGEEVLVRKGMTVRGLDDFKGLKIRVAGGELVELVRALGAKPVFIPPPEVYTGLQRGTIDAAIFPIHDLELLKLREVVGQSVGPDFLFSGPMLHLFKVNLAAWDRLGADVQASIREVVKRAAARDDAHAVKELEAPYRERAVAAGVKFATLADADVKRAMEAVGVARSYYVTKSKEQGFGAESEKILAILRELAGQ